MSFTARAHWIFDMDGTLTVAVHDFEAIRTELGLEPKQPILEQLALLPRARQVELFARLDALELELARGARAAEGAIELLSALQSRSVRIGILTRNSHATALETLRAAGLERFFAPERIVDRDAAEPKPHPAGIHVLLRAWGARAEDTVMVGDYQYDLLAGRAAGTATIYVDPSGAFPWARHADVSVRSLAKLALELEARA